MTNWPPLPSPYYSDDWVAIYCGDCLDIMEDFDIKTFGFCFTDPPYNVGKDYGVYKDSRSDADYRFWIAKILNEIMRVSDKSCIFTPQKWACLYWQILGDSFKQIILSYSPHGTIRYGFINQFSHLLTNAKPIDYCQNVWHNCQMTGLGYFFREDTYGHPGYTSLDITSRVFGHLCGPGKDIVFDPFLGTGTSAVIARSLNRRCIGIEISEKYCEIAAQRCRQEVLDLRRDG